MEANEGRRYRKANARERTRQLQTMHMYGTRRGRKLAQMRLKRKSLTGPIAAVVMATIIITIVLFVPPYVGMEDNGDFSRVTYGEGLYDLPENSELLYNGYFIKEYGIMQYYNEYSNTVYSSQFIFIRPAILLDQMFTGSDDIFDLRFLGIVYTLYFLAVLYFLVDYLSNKLTLVCSLLVAAVSVFVFVDTSYTAYFNSFYAEPLAYISLLACITCALLYSDDRYDKFVLLGGFLLNGMILTFSKQQFAPIGVLLGILSLFFYLKTSGRLYKWLIAVSSAVLAVSGILTYTLISNDFTNINMYHSMTRGVLMTSYDPPETLDTFGIDSQYELLNGTIYFDKYPEIDPENEMLKEDFYSHYNVLSIVKHYASDPGAFAEMLKLAAKNAYKNRPSMGNYEYSAGYPPNSIAQVFSVHSNIKAAYTPKTLGYIIIWMIAALVLLFRKRLKQIIVLGLIIIGLSQIIVSVIGAGDADLAKHIFLYNVTYDIVNVILFAHIVKFFDEKYRAKKYGTLVWEDIDQASYKNT